MARVYHCVACQWPIAPYDQEWLYGGGFRVKPYQWITCARCDKAQKWRPSPLDVVERLDTGARSALKTKSSAPGASG